MDLFVLLIAGASAFGVWGYIWYATGGRDDRTQVDWRGSLLGRRILDQVKNVARDIF